ncbi:uncharacterized protein LOC142784480 isoform X2 [Rhipicephalus microplus]|uniref:uncharacterized protein LOC142784480 isoform X2 n=1 Tax=Rhipicephalus microplus TaxID=6941 RepID=UPI003F6B60CE
MRQLMEASGVPGLARPNVDAGHSGVLPPDVDADGAAFKGAFNQVSHLHLCLRELPLGVDSTPGMSLLVAVVQAGGIMAGHQSAASPAAVSNIPRQAKVLRPGIHLLQCKHVVIAPQKVLCQVVSPLPQPVDVPLKNAWAAALARSGWGASHDWLWGEESLPSVNRWLEGGGPGEVTLPQTAGCAAGWR